MESNSGKRKPVRQLAAPSIHGETYRGNSTTRGPQIDYRNFTFQELEEEEEVSFERYCGPTPESNWVIPGKLLVGAYPASVDDQETFELLTSIMLLGVTKFVCLQQEYRSRGVTEHMWRNGQALRPYFEDVRTIAREKDAFPMIPGIKDLYDENKYKFVHFPIRDCSVTDDDRVQNLCIDLVRAISHGEILYIHCWGGHGRTGTVVSIMLYLMYGLNADDAMARCQLCHDLRQCPVAVGSPQTQTQRDQVARVIARLQSQAQKEALKESHKRLQQPLAHKSISSVDSGSGHGLSRATTARGTLRDGALGVAMTPGRQQPTSKITRLNPKNAGVPSHLLKAPPVVKPPPRKANVSQQALHGLYTVTESGVPINSPTKLAMQSNDAGKLDLNIAHTSMIPVPTRRHTYGDNDSSGVIAEPPAVEPVKVAPELPTIAASASLVKSNSTSKLGNGAINRMLSTLKPPQEDTDKPAISLDQLPTELETYSEDFEDGDEDDAMAVDGKTGLVAKPPSEPMPSTGRRRRSNQTTPTDGSDETRSASAVNA